MIDPSSVICPSCGAAAGKNCVPSDGNSNIAPSYCPERKLLAVRTEEEELQRLIYEW
jgi:hypothetical protein